jgi:hypothetical protein
MEDKIIAIHQPNFFPWLGYFDKINRSDIFVLLDDAQLQKTGAGWSSRVQLAISGEVKWFTVPIARNYTGTASINSVEFDNKVPWRKKLVKTLEANYRKALFFKDVFPFLKTVIEFSEQNVARYNTYCLTAILNELRISTPLVLASELNVNQSSTQRLITITKILNGTTYLCGGGAGGYQEDHLFPAANLVLKYQNFQHPTYEQKTNEGFIKGLSIIDVLMHCGVEGTRKLIIDA